MYVPTPSPPPHFTQTTHTDSQASIFGYKEDLGIDQTGYNLISTIFFVPYGLFEVPSQICLMYIAPHTWISVMGLAWGITMTMNGLVKNFGGAMAGRFILGGTYLSLNTSSPWLAREKGALVPLHSRCP